MEAPKPTVKLKFGPVSAAAFTLSYADGRGWGYWDVTGQRFVGGYATREAAFGASNIANDSWVDVEKETG